MKRFAYSLGALFAIFALAPSLSFAQATGSGFVSVSSAPAGSSTYSPGAQNANLGTITLTGTQQGSVQVSSLPLTLTTTGGAQPSDLSNCQLTNASGQALNTGTNIPASITTGTNTLTLNQPLTLSYNSPTILGVHCNIASTASIGSSYAFSAAAPTLAPSLGVSLTTFPTVTPGEVAAPIAAITLNPSASGSNLSVSALPVTLTFGGGLSPANISDCRIRSTGTSLSNNYSGSVVSGANTVTLDTPLSLTGGAAATPLMLTCNVASTAPVGGTISIAMTPASVPAMVAGTNASVTPMVASGTGGSASSLSGVTTVSNASGSVAGSGSTTGTVGVTGTNSSSSGFVGGPNTGGTDPLLYVLLAAALVLGGLAIQSWNASSRTDSDA